MLDSVRDAAATGTVVRGDFRSAALVAIAGESVERVVFGNGQQQVPMQARVLRETDVELTGAWFLPRSCQLEIEFPDLRARAKDGGPEETLRAVGTVSKVQMCGHEPTYSIRVHLDEIRPSQQAWRAALQRASGAPASEG